MKNKIMVLYTIAISSILLVSVATAFAQMPPLESKTNVTPSEPESEIPIPVPSEDNNKLVLGPVTIPLDKETKLKLETADSTISISPKK